ncbi:hypothetical protein [Psychromicrobium lacuslunae]|uniref:Uncharacterized protein n=1 Tax=Psychromicrobium lacuslunae TaxID=1618207 RepID=A0A0D4C1E1_9MICC|nr:hypothetical protein [Psychromicrobium lacuslunae]AJT42215.1 hypothetical protein UM93_13165 [Psychromicrobium lacuslunae]
MQLEGSNRPAPSRRGCLLLFLILTLSLGLLAMHSVSMGPSPIAISSGVALHQPDSGVIKSGSAGMAHHAASSPAETSQAVCCPDPDAGDHSMAASCAPLPTPGWQLTEPQPCELGLTLGIERLDEISLPAQGRPAHPPSLLQLSISRR